MRATLVGLTLGALVSSLAGQDAKSPAGWQTRLDRAGGSAMAVTAVGSGFEVQSGRSAGIVYNSSHTAHGAFRARATIDLVRSHGPREAFGLFVGGRQLQGDAQHYLYFLIRPDGRFLIKRRDGVSTSTLQPWTEHAAVARPGGSAPTRNALAIETSDTQVRFFVNNQQVASLPKADIQADGVVGIRVNHGLELRVTEISAK